ncbi:hypothetical protein DPMN_002337 [Dreissena polymorpha]|uniref:Uncharacterized protein n=1 Tax=Dreissena polymorpha TaxID=45954 RepID=A0A9D4RRN5_DREPO|nr:hypothetical protein DPMN_002337 [Dreissena polymorpha]
MTLSKAVFSPRLQLLSHENLTVSNAVLASPFMRSHVDLTISNAVLAIPAMRSHDDLTFPKASLASPFIRSHDDMTLSKAVLASLFLRSHDDIKVSKAVIAHSMCYVDDRTVPNALLASAFIRSHDDFIVPNAALAIHLMRSTDDLTDHWLFLRVFQVFSRRPYRLQGFSCEYMFSHDDPHSHQVVCFFSRHFMIFHGDLSVSKAARASPLMRYHYGLTV